MPEHQDLRRRTKEYAGRVIRLYTQLPRARAEVDVVGKQLLRAATSVAAHYREASRARSRADFISKIGGCLQEADESQLWLELLRDDCALDHEEIGALCEETDELISICVAMQRNTRQRGL